MSMRSRLRPYLAGLALATAVAGSVPAWADDVAVVNRVVYPGETIGAETIQLVPFKPTKAVMSPVATVAEDIEGKVARRTLLPGKLIPLSSLREPYIVEAGSPVTVMFVQGGLVIAATAVPLHPGGIGDIVKLRNIDSGKVFAGVALADGTVRVGQ